MPADWNAEINNETIWNDVDFIQMFWKAVNERRAVIFPTASGSGAADLPYPVAGAVIQGDDTNVSPLDVGVVTITRTGSTARASFFGTPPFVGNHIVVQGAAQEEYNGTHIVTARADNGAFVESTFDYEVEGAPVTPATTLRNINWYILFDQTGTFDTQFSIRDIQGMIATQMSFFMDPTYVSGSSTASSVPLVTYTVGGLNSSGFRRRRPREVLSSGSTTDTQGNTAATGQFAISLFSFPTTIVRYDGSVWRETEATKSISSLTRSGTTATATVAAHGYATNDIIRIAGATPSGYNGDFRITVIAANRFTYEVTAGLSTPAGGTKTAAKTFKTTQPDTLDSDSAAPNNIAYGLLVEGDYIGWWLFKECRDMLNVMVWPFAEAIWSTTDTNNTRTGSGASQAAAALAYGSSSSTSATGAPMAYSRTNSDGSAFNVGRRYNTAKATLVNPFGLTRDLVLYVRLGLPPVGSEPHTYDQQNDSMMPATGNSNEWHEIDVEAGKTDNSYTSIVVGSASAGGVPTWGANNTRLGYQAGLTVIQRFDRENGFTYRPPDE